MTRRTRSKLNRLLRSWPRGAVATQAWLDELGISRQLAGWYVESGWLERVGWGAYRRAGEEVEWTGGLYALQRQLELSVHPGGITALELLGLARNVPLGENPRALLVSDRPERLPRWFCKAQWDVVIEHRCLRLFEPVPVDSMVERDAGGFMLLISSPERAILEEMHRVRGSAGVEHAVDLMEGLGSLRPDLIQALLESCRSIKAKRLFLWSAETIGHAWLSRIDPSHVELGRGKRQLIPGGRLDAKYLITVPRGDEPPDA